MPVVSQPSTALIPVVTVTLNGPGLIEGPTSKKKDCIEPTQKGCILVPVYISPIC